MNELDEMAGKTGGRRWTVGEPADIPDVYARLAGRLTASYRLVFDTAGLESRDGFRRIRVRVKRRGARAVAPPGFFEPATAPAQAP
jgi:hypothetical protein